MSKCYLLGAGASIGYAESIPKQLRPPSSWDFFLRGRDLGVLDRDKYPDLYDKLEEYIGEGDIEELPPSDLQFDIEDFLGRLGDEFEENSETDHGHKAHSALGQAIFYIYDLFRLYRILYTPEYDNYRRLAMHYYDQPYNVVCLNYDTVFESAVESVGLNVHYGLGNQFPPRSVKISKIHGSINWINRYKSIKVGESGELQEIAGFVFSNVVHGNATQLGILPVGSTDAIDVQNLIRSSSDFDVPAIIPPVAGHKRYEKVEEYQQVHQMAEGILRDATELVIIGSSLRKEDDVLLSMLDENLSDGIDVKVVSRGDTQRVKEKIEVLIDDANVDTSHQEFSEYARSL